MNEHDNVLPFKPKVSYDQAMMKEIHGSDPLLPITTQIAGNFMMLAEAVRNRLLIDPDYEMTKDEMFAVCVMMGVKITYGGSENTEDAITIITLQTEPVSVVWDRYTEKFLVSVDRAQ